METKILGIDGFPAQRLKPILEEAEDQWVEVINEEVFLQIWKMESEKLKTDQSLVSYNREGTGQGPNVKIDAPFSERLSMR